MKFVLLSVAALILAIGIPVLVVFLINRKHRIKNYVKAIVIPVSSLTLLVSFMLSYFAFNYPASHEARSFLKSDETVAVTEEKNWYRFDGKGSDETAIVFYGGAKVDPAAYAPLCSGIAHEGIDVYMIRSPLFFPLFSANAAQEVADLHRHGSLYLMGHSLGGTTAGMFLSGQSDVTFKGIVFLASYSTKKLDDSLRCLSLYGTNDLVLEKDAYEKNRGNLPSGYQEIVIEGGNHAQFGDYGAQRGDGLASISRDEQTRITKDAVLDFIGNA